MTLMTQPRRFTLPGALLVSGELSKILFPSLALRLACTAAPRLLVSSHLPKEVYLHHCGVAHPLQMGEGREGEAGHRLDDFLRDRRGVGRSFFALFWTPLRARSKHLTFCKILLEEFICATLELRFCLR